MNISWRPVPALPWRSSPVYGSGVEYAGRQAGLLDRNLGWGFYVDFTIQVVVTAAFLLIVSLREIARLVVK